LGHRLAQAGVKGRWVFITVEWTIRNVLTEGMISRCAAFVRALRPRKREWNCTTDQAALTVLVDSITARTAYWALAPGNPAIDAVAPGAAAALEVLSVAIVPAAYQAALTVLIDPITALAAAYALAPGNPIIDTVIPSARAALKLLFVAVVPTTHQPLLTVVSFR